MNKTFQRIFAKAKSENKSCFVGFVTGMDPDYESSKQILIELSKYCSVLEVGVSFNTSTSDSSIIMSANDRAIKSGAKTEKVFQLIKDVKKEIISDTAFVTMGYLNQIHVYGIDRYIEDCKKSGVDGCIVVDSNNEAPEDDQIFKGLTKNDMAFIKLIAPGFSGIDEKFKLAVDLTRITFPFLFFISIASFFSAILNLSLIHI